MVVEAQWAMLDLGAAERARFAALLTPDERRRAGEFRRTADRRRYIVRRGRLRELLAARLECAPRDVPLSYNAFGKPWIENTDLRFNLSHSRGLALYVIGRGVELGCDIEWRRSRLATKSAAERFFSEREIEMLRSVPRNEWVEAFFNCWTRKEALVKALGFGISYPLKGFDVALRPGEEAAILHGPSEWSLRSFAPAVGLHAAIVTNATRWDVVIPVVPAL
jgi:4'-phosphopantetheinyl transferase